MTEDGYYLSTEAARRIAKEIDKEIMDSLMSDKLIRDNWTVSNISSPKWPFDRPSWATDTAEWCHKHCSGDYKLLNGYWHFQKAEDATMFALKWS